jgi:hypothetical protein
MKRHEQSEETMATQPKTLRDLMTRAAADEGFRDRLAADPIGVAHAEGVQVDVDFIKERLGIAGASDLELVQMLQSRLAGPVQGYGAFCVCM